MIGQRFVCVSQYGKRTELAGLMEPDKLARLVGWAKDALLDRTVEGSRRNG
jgi:hypothetical protein